MVTYFEGPKPFIGSYTISGDSLTVQVNSRTFSYTITSNTSFSGYGETWVRTGF
jgi:hypothetical protein